MKSETDKFVFTTPPDSKQAELTILQKPIKGSPYIQLNINDLADVAVLKALLGQPAH